MADLNVQVFIDGKALDGGQVEEGSHQLKIVVQCPDGSPGKNCTVTVEAGQGNQTVHTDSRGIAYATVSYSGNFSGAIKVKCSCAEEYVYNYSVSFEYHRFHASILKFASSALSAGSIRTSLRQAAAAGTPGRASFLAKIERGTVDVLGDADRPERHLSVHGDFDVVVQSTDNEDVVELVLQELQSRRSYFRLIPGTPSRWLVNLKNGDVSGDLHTHQMAKAPYRYDASVAGSVSIETGSFSVVTLGRRRPLSSNIADVAGNPKEPAEMGDTVEVG